MRFTRTRTRTILRFADPYKTCEECGEWIVGVYEPDGIRNAPCDHRASYRNLCPSWGPVDGCCCAEFLGHVPHAEPPSPPKGAGG